MIIEYKLLFTAIISLSTGAIMTWIYLRSGIAATIQAIRSELVSELDKTRIRLEDKERIVIEYLERINKGEQRITDLEQERNLLDKRWAMAEQKAERLQILETELHNARKQSENQKALIVELNTRIEDERNQAEEKLALINGAKNELSNHFKILAQDIFEDKNRKLSDDNISRISALLTPFREQLTEFRKKVDDVYVNESKDRASLRQELENLRLLNQQINKEAENLTNALKGNKKIQGNWGELVLEQVLEQSGLRKGFEYESQSGFRNSDNNLLKPDIVIHLPEGKDVVIDSKVSLVDYERYANADDDTIRHNALAAHIQAMRNHIEKLSNKDYTSLKGIRSLDFVLMFIPIEASFMTAFSNDDKLFSYAFERRIVVVTPTTLLATLRTIENIWRYERQNRNALAIAKRASAVYDKLCAFIEDMEKIGKQLQAVHITYEDAMSKLVRGKGNLINQANRFVELGIKVKKEFPKSVTEIAEINQDDIL